MKASDVYLFTATALLLIALITTHYDITTYEDEDDFELSAIADNTGVLMLYSHEIFMESEFEFVRADTLHGYALYEVTGNGDGLLLKSQLRKYLEKQGYENGLVIFVLDENNLERVKEII